MKKQVLMTLLALLSLQGIHAQSRYESYGLFDHLGVGVSLGTDGIGFDLAAPITDYAALRAGVSFWPKVKYTNDIKINDNNPLIADHVDLEAKLNIFNFKLLADVYPFKGSSFHVTAGAFIGKKELASAYNTSTFIKDPSKYGRLGLKLGDYRITTDQAGNIKADATVNSFKPYVGVGLGRAVPKKSRVSVSCDFGVMFWGKPKVGAMTRDDWGNETYHQFKHTELDEYDDEDLKDALEIAEKISVFPVLNIRLSGRIF